MSIKFLRSILIINSILVLLAVFNPASEVQALAGMNESPPLPDLDTFINLVRNGKADELRGVYIPDILATYVIQQPEGMDGFVSSSQNNVTQFGLASQFGSIGVLAHNNLTGESFTSLEEGQEFFLIYGDGRVSVHVVTEILRYRALEPASVSSDFIDLENGGLLTASELFSKIYERPGHVIFQTCISADGNLAWGRLFVIAEPGSKYNSLQP